MRLWAAFANIASANKSSPACVLIHQSCRLPSAQSCLAENEIYMLLGRKAKKVSPLVRRLEEAGTRKAVRNFSFHLVIMPNINVFHRERKEYVKLTFSLMVSVLIQNKTFFRGKAVGKLIRWWEKVEKEKHSNLCDFLYFFGTFLRCFG